jgi:hypothetical protein
MGATPDRQVPETTCAISTRSAPLAYVSMIYLPPFLCEPLGGGAGCIDVGLRRIAHHQTVDRLDHVSHTRFDD